jgi:hypothetical protein
MEMKMREKINEGAAITALAMELIATEPEGADGARQIIKGLMYVTRLIDTLGPIALQHAMADYGFSEIDFELIALEVAEGR